MQNIANDYFNGKTTREDEKALEEFVGADEKNMALFRLWEAEWAADHVISSSAERSFERFVRETRARLPRHGNHSRLWRYAAAAAVLLAIMGGSAFTAWTLAKPQPEKYYTFTVPYGSKSCMELPDGSVVWLNAGSKLRYSDCFDKDSRHLELEGEGYFCVNKDNDRPFVVKTKACDITVKGTRFNVSAYADDALTSVSLMQGSVQVNSAREEKTISPGEKITVDRQTGKIARATYEATANTWIDNSIDFESISLRELTKILSRQFNVNFIIRSERLAGVRFSVILKQKESVADVMKALQTTHPMTVVRKGKDIYIYD